MGSQALEVLQNVVRTVYSTLHLPASRIIVRFDGRAPSTTDAQWYHYQRKIRDFKTWVQGNASLSNVHIYENLEWLHAARSFKVSYESVRDSMTPLIFWIEEDSLVYGD